MAKSKHMRAQRSGPRQDSSLYSLRTIEKTQQRLWVLACVLLLLVSLSLLTLDATSAAAERLISGATNRAHLLFDQYGTALALLAIVSLACIYIYQQLLLARNRNRELVQALDASARVLALRNHQLDTWDQLSHQLITNFNLPRLLDLIVETAAQVTASDSAAVIVSDRDTPHLRLGAIHHRGMQTELARRVAAKVIATGESVEIARDSVPEEFDRPDLAWEGLIAMAATPLVAAGAIHGALIVGRLQPAGPYPRNIIEVLGSFASQASIALEKAHLYAETQSQLQRLGKLLEELRFAQSRLGDSEPVSAPKEAMPAETAGTQVPSSAETPAPA